jgi:hypothetical protein
MSVSASINIIVAKNEQQSIFAARIIEQLLSYGWSLNDYGQMTYLPVGDQGDYNWQSEIISKEKLIKIVGEKEKNNEVVGIVLTWKDTNIGGDLLVWKDGSLSFSLSVNRKILNEDISINVTDVNWYLEKLLSGLNAGHFSVMSFSFEQIF